MPAPMNRFEALRHRTVELAGMAALGVAVTTCPAQAQNTMKEKAQVKQQLQTLIEILFGLHVARQRALD